MSDNVVQLPGTDVVGDMLGPKFSGHSVIIDGRLIPDLHAYDRGESIEFVLDGRLAFEFPREWAFLAAAFAANAMAIGAGFPSLNGRRCEHFASQVGALPEGVLS